MPRLGESTQPVITDPELASARLAAIQQTPDAQERSSEHPMVTYAKNLLSPLNYQSQVPQDFNPYDTAGQRGGTPFDFSGLLNSIGNTKLLPLNPLSPTLGDINPVATGAQPSEEFYGKGSYPADVYQRPVTGGIGRVLTSPLAQKFQPNFENLDNPLNALAVTGGLVGPAEESAQAVLGKLGQGARELTALKGPQFLREAAGEGRLDLGLGGGISKTDAAKALADAEDAYAAKYTAPGQAIDEAARTRDLAQIARLRRVAEQSGAAVEIASLPSGNLEQRIASRGKEFRNYSDEQLLEEAQNAKRAVDRSKVAFNNAKERLKGSGSTNSAQVQDTGSAARGNAMRLNAIKKELQSRGLPTEQLFGAAVEKAALPEGNLEQRQLARLRESGATDTEIAEFQKTMAPAPEKPGIQTAEGQPLSPSVLTRALQTAAGTEGVPLSQHPVFSPYGTGGAKVGAKGPVGGDIGTATRAVMSGDPKAMDLLGPELTQQLIQNKIAHIVRETGAPQDVVTRGLSLLGPERSVLPSAEIANVGRNARAIEDAIGAPRPGFAKTAEDLVAERTVPGEPPIPPAPPPSGTGAMPPDLPIPPGPDRGSAGEFAKALAAEIAALPRALKAGLDLSAVLLQGAPLISKDIAKLPYYGFTKLRGGAQRPYFHSALGQMFRAVASGEGRVAQVTQGFRESLEAEGFHTSGPLKNIHISDPSAPFGALTAREEYMVGDLTTKIPIIGLGYRQGNFAYATLLNGLRTGEALNLVRAAKAAKIPVNHAKIGHFVDIATGYGDLPFQDTEVARQVSTAMSNVFFGPRLMTSSWQNAVDNIAAIGGIGKSLISRKPLDPTDLARIQTTAAFVAAGVGAMKIAEASGMPIGTDPTKTDFGRITLPDGSRLDLWGPFNENARLVARELEHARQTANGDAPGYGATTGIDELVNYFRGRLNPPVGVAADVLSGTTGAGIPTREAYSSTDPNVNPLIPAPFSVGTALNAAKTGGGLGAAELTAGVFGASVLPPSTHIAYDGLGKPETDQQYGKDPVLDEFVRLAKQDPNFDQDAVMAPPNTTLGSGRNSVKLDAASAPKYIQAVGEARRVALGDLIYSQDYQNATTAQKEKLYKVTMTEANSKGEREFLARDVVSSNDPAVVRAEAVTGFHGQATNQDRAYWVALLDRAGKLTSEVRSAIDDSQVTLPGQKAPITTEEYLRYAPLVHEYLAHVPYGTDAHPIGTPQDWTAAAQAREAKNVRRDELIRGGTNPSLADTMAQNEILKSMTSLVQRNLYLNGTQLENPARKLLASKYPNLSRFIDQARKSQTQESEAEYRDFPFGP